MLKKDITYTDFNGEQQTETFYFNLTKAEALELEVSTKDKNGFSGLLKSIVASEDPYEMLAIFKKIILLAYGVRSDDGKLFIKNEKLRDEFTQHAAFSELYMGFLTNADEATTFINGILPDVSDLPNPPGVPQDHLSKELPSAKSNELTDQMEFDEWRAKKQSSGE